MEIIRTLANVSRSLGVMMISGVRSNMKFLMCSTSIGELLPGGYNG